MLRIRPIFDKQDISFKVGFNFQNKWFYSINLENSAYEEDYATLVTHIQRCNGISMLNETKENYTIPGTDLTTEFTKLE